MDEIGTETTLNPTRKKRRLSLGKKEE